MALAGSQDEVVTRAQLAEVGFTHDAVGSRTAQGIWQGLGPRVVVLHSGPLTPAQAWWSGFLHAEPDAVLALATAAEAGGSAGSRSPRSTLPSSTVGRSATSSIPG